MTDTSTSTLRAAARNVLSNWLTFVFAAVVSFFLSPFVVRSLGETQYGAWVLLGSLVGNLGLLDIGIRVAVQRYVARFHAAGEHEQATRLYSTAVRMFLLAGAVATLIATVLSFMLGHAFNVPPDLVPVARMVMVLGGVNIAASLLGGVYGGVLCGLERFDYANGIELSITALRAVATVVALETGHGLIGLALVQLVATLLKIYACTVATRRLYPQLVLTTWLWDSASAKLLLGYGLTASLLHVSYAIMFYSDSIIIGAYLPVAMITYFAIAGNLSDYARSVVSGVSQTLSPRLSALEVSGRASALRDATLTMARVSSIVVAPIAATFLATGPAFIGLWMGPKYVALSGLVLRVLSFPLVVLSGYQIVSAALFGVGKHAKLIPMFVFEAISNIVLSIIWVRAYGVIGTALGTVVPRVIVSTFVGPWYAKRTFGIPVSQFLRSVFLLPMLAMIPFAVATGVVEALWPATNLALYFIRVLALLPLAGISAWYVCFSRAERDSIRARLGRTRARRFAASPSQPLVATAPAESK